MSTLVKLVGACCLVGGIVGLLLSGWAFIDPAAFPHLAGRGAMAPPSPRWAAAFGFMFSLLLVAAGSGRLRHRALP